ncbi:MAG: hypothetical protein KKF44_08405 [Nanoarchaeota archaeon]|nr:hypothetical protein [Nanoarchaeota archaeon]
MMVKAAVICQRDILKIFRLGIFMTQETLAKAEPVKKWSCAWGFVKWT